MNTVTDETPSLQDELGDANISGFGLPDRIDADAFPDDPPTEAELDAMFVAEMERRDAELVDLLRRSIALEYARRRGRIIHSGA